MYTTTNHSHTVHGRAVVARGDIPLVTPTGATGDHDGDVLVTATGHTYRARIGASAKQVRAGCKAASA